MKLDINAIQRRPQAEVLDAALAKTPLVMEALGVSSVNTLKGLERRGVFTAGILVSPRERVWPWREVVEITAAMAAGASQDELKQLVGELMAQRQERARALRALRAKNST
jgi:hypothetical protein